MTFESPEGWALVSLGEVCELNPGKPPVDALSSNALVSFVPMPAVDGDRGAIVSPSERPFLEVRKGYTAFREEDVIFAKITPCMENGKAAVARNLVNGLGFGSTEFHVLRSFGATVSDYVYHFVRQEAFRREAESEMTGSVGQKRVPTDFLRSYEFPLPPLAEQHRIVAKVEELLARVNAARERLARVPALLKRFRQAVLAAACSGRLTEEWRQNGSSDQTASELLAEVARERESSSGARRRADRPMLAVEVDGDHELPESWAWTTFGFISINFDGRRVPIKQDDRANRRGQYPYYGASGPIDTIDDFLFDGHYLLIGEDGANLLARSTPIAFRATGKFWVNNHAHVVQVYCGIRLEYLEVYFNWLDLQEFVTGSAQPKLTQDNLNRVPVPLPPSPEQHEIVRRVQNLLALADAIEKRVAQATARVEKTTQAILAKAFRGELVPAEAELARQEGRDYEPASVLLERVRAERAGASVGASGRRSGVKATPCSRRDAETSRTPKSKVLSASPRLRASHALGSPPGARNIPDAILAHLQPGRAYSRAEVCEALGLNSAEWTWAIRELKESGRVVQEGERRGARYSLARRAGKGASA